MGRQCHCGLSRRDFLRAAGGTIACWSLLPLSESILDAQPLSRTPIFAKSKAKVTLVFTHIPSGHPTWPMKDYDYDGRAKELGDKLVKGCPGIDFTVKHAGNDADAQAIMKESADADGYVVYLLGIWPHAVVPILHSGKPVVMVDDLFAGSGEMLIHTGGANREKLPFISISSSDMNDVIGGVRLFEVISSLKQSRILDVVDYDVSGWAAAEKNVGPKVIKLPFQELADYYTKADEKEANEWADYWVKNAKKVVEPTRKDIVDGGKMYLALCRACAEKRCDAVSMDCLGGFYSGRITAYPCLSFFQMNNDGGTGVCEGDINSTCTQLMMRYLTGRPGYVSDPVIDTSKSEIIYAHCVAHNRAFGPKGKANPYIIRSHREDDKGAVVQSLLPLGEQVTTLEIDTRGKRMVIHTGKTTRNVDEPKACRTKLAARTDAERILENWDMGWHRVTVYGDHRKQAMNLARLLGISVFEEDKA
jgi:hypothetical protein